MTTHDEIPRREQFAAGTYFNLVTDDVMGRVDAVPLFEGPYNLQSSHPVHPRRSDQRVSVHVRDAGSGVLRQHLAPRRHRRSLGKCLL